jgi:hypothetical protein
MQTDAGAFSIRRLTISSRVVTTLAGGIQGDADGVGTNARFVNPKSISVDAAAATAVVVSAFPHHDRSY